MAQYERAYVRLDAARRDQWHSGDRRAAKRTRRLMERVARAAMAEVSGG